MRAHDAKSNGVPNARLLCVRWGERTIDGDVYTLDPAGNRTAKQDDLAGVTSNYTYDKIYELTQVTQGTSTTESYSYDPVGNRLNSLGVSSYTVNSSNELTADSNESYTYDNNGNTTSKTDSTGTTNYTWDFENRLKQITLPGAGGTVAFLYDPFGRRIQKAFTQNGTTTFTNYVYNGDNTVETIDQNGSITAKFAQRQNIDEPLAESTSGGTDYYEADGLGSITSLTGATGSIAQTYTYDSFGNTTNSSGNVANPFRYTGRNLDTETGLYYYRARYYDANTGRFLSEDPIQFAGGRNVYQYVGGNPILYVDPFGYAPGDKWYGYNDRDFQDWFHRDWKQPGDPDATKEEMETAYEEWKRQGSPTRDPKHERRKPCDEPDPAQEPEPEPQAEPDAEPGISKAVNWAEQHPVTVGVGVAVVGGVIIFFTGGTAAPFLAGAAAL